MRFSLSKSVKASRPHQASSDSQGVSAGGVRGPIVALCAVVTAAAPVACSREDSGTAPQTFDVTGHLTGNTYLGVEQDGTCRFADATYSAGQQVVLRGADDRILATSQLTRGPDTFPGAAVALCDLVFHFDKVKTGEVAYQIVIGKMTPIIVNQRQMIDKDFKLRPREGISMARNGESIIEVYPPQ